MQKFNSKIFLHLVCFRKFMLYIVLILAKHFYYMRLEIYFCLEMQFYMFMKACGGVFHKVFHKGVEIVQSYAIISA